MKRIFSMILAVSLAVALLSGAAVFAADYDDEYVYSFGDPQTAVTAITVLHMPNANEGYGTMTTNGADPWFFIRVDIPSTQKYVAVKYASDFELAGNLVITAGDEGSTTPILDWGMEGTEADPQMIADGEWHLAIYEIASTFTGMKEEYNLQTFRLPGVAEVGESYDVAYVGFFKTVEEAKAFDADYSYDYDLPSDSAEVKDPANTDEPADPADTDEPAGPTDTEPADTENPTSGDSTVAMLVLVVMAAASVAMVMRKRSYEG